MELKLLKERAEGCHRVAEAVLGGMEGYVARIECKGVTRGAIQGSERLV